MRHAATSLSPSRLLFTLGILVVVPSSRSLGTAKVNRHKPWIEELYHGVVTENEEEVLLSPPLVAMDHDAPTPYAGEICGFRVLGAGTPFEGVVVNSSTGEGVLRARPGLDCESKTEYEFGIQALDCGEDGQHRRQRKSHRATVRVQVQDVNEFVPKFTQPVYEVTLLKKETGDEPDTSEPENKGSAGRGDAVVLRVEATDGDCSPQFGQICGYEILTPGSPFSIDMDGNVRVSGLLPDADGSERTMEFIVTAFDCGKRRAQRDAIVRIHIRAPCRHGWQGWSDTIEYPAGGGALPLFPGIALETCQTSPTSLQASVAVETGVGGRTCDRDTYSELSRRRLCDAASGAVELLQAASNHSSKLPSSSRHHFEGSEAFMLNQALNLSGAFSLSVWLRHRSGGDAREAIICEGDRTGTGIRKLSLFLHECRVIFSFRRDVIEQGGSHPADFYWKLEQACDNEWHFYVINVDYPAVTLLVDGVSYDPYQVSSDWPISGADLETQVVIGACWQGGEAAQLGDYLYGELWGLLLRSGIRDSRRDIACLLACQEGLDFSAFDSLGRGMKVHFNPTQSVLTLEGDDPEAFSRTLRHAAYLNSRFFPSPGPRRVTISTQLTCAPDSTCPSVPPVSAYVVVGRAPEPQLWISAASPLAPEASDLAAPGGVPLTPALRILSFPRINSDIEAQSEENNMAEGERAGSGLAHNLEACEVLAQGSTLASQYEELLLLLPSELASMLTLHSSAEGLLIDGVAPMAVYQQALRHLAYRNTNLHHLTRRSFVIRCTELSGRFLSNDFVLEVNPLHSAHLPGSPSHLIAEPRLASDAADSNVGSSTTTVLGISAVVVVVAVCVVLGAVTLGVARVRATQRGIVRTGAEGREGEMDWDDSGLTITVNPMESCEETGISEDEVGLDEESSEGEGYGEEEEEEEEEEESRGEAEGGPGREGHLGSSTPYAQLEWDDSTLSY
uniref:Cadherin domain-containing protein n=1 Tax=Eptatretus burgeri TaxID=7764 RepID=A0A8C4QZF4_EPTBU